MIDKEETLEQYCDRNNIKGQISMDDYIKWLELKTGETLYKEIKYE